MTAAELNLAFAREVAGLIRGERDYEVIPDYTRDWNAVLAQIHKRGLEWEKNHSSWLPEVGAKKIRVGTFQVRRIPKEKEPSGFWYAVDQEPNWEPCHALCLAAVRCVRAMKSSGAEVQRQGESGMKDRIPDSETMSTLKIEDNKAWRVSGKHLPKFMRDFHDQKNLFRTIHEAYRSEDPQNPINVINWVDAHIYTIDCFLWFMATHGYTLQKSRKRVLACDIEVSLKDAQDLRDKHFKEALQTMLKENNRENPQ